MSMVINTNMQSQAAANSLSASQNKLSNSLQRLSSGSKIVNPSDDAGGLAVAMKLDSRVARLTSAQSNVQNAISFTQTQDGYLRNISKALDRMGELAILSQDVTKTDADRTLYDKEFQQLTAYVTDAASKDFNGISLFNGSTMAVTTDADGNTFDMGGINLGSTSYTDATGSSIGTTANATSALSAVKTAIETLANDRASIGAYQSRLNSTSNQLSVSRENLSAARSRIQDVDVAQEATEYARYNILVQSGTAMLAQANQLPQNVLQLLQ